jgi:hypothetical protein
MGALMRTTTAPIPATMYDADYYNGVTSNYTKGYTWDTMGSLFTVTARLLTWLFPETQTCLDFGAAKGFMIKALRELGKDAWGVDHSPYCLEVAEPEAKPTLMPTLDDLPPGRTFDLVTTFETLEHLTKAQIAEVLPALRLKTRSILFATMPTTDMPNKKALEMADREVTHVTIVHSSWWIEQFEAAGFVHGPWQRLAERQCMLHPLVQEVGWRVFLMGVPA